MTDSQICQFVRGRQSHHPSLSPGRPARVYAYQVIVLDELALVEPDTVRPWLDGLAGKARLLAAAWLGDVRLLDNMAVRLPGWSAVPGRSGSTSPGRADLGELESDMAELRRFDMIARRVLSGSGRGDA